MNPIVTIDLNEYERLKSLSMVEPKEPEVIVKIEKDVEVRAKLKKIEKFVEAEMEKKAFKSGFINALAAQYLADIKKML